MTTPSPWQRLTFRLGWWLRGALALFPLTGCATAPLVCTKRLPKSHIAICYGEQRAVFVACGGTENYTDAGRKIRWDDDYAGCYDETEKIIYCEDSKRGWVAAALHERAHEEGVANPRGEGYDVLTPVAY